MDLLRPMGAITGHSVLHLIIALRSVDDSVSQSCAWELQTLRKICKLAPLLSWQPASTTLGLSHLPLQHLRADCELHIPFTRSIVSHLRCRSGRSKFDNNCQTCWLQH